MGGVGGGVSDGVSDGVRDGVRNGNARRRRPVAAGRRTTRLKGA
jgi:hypothetical protein